jgi:hypothetical protein
MMTDEIRAKLAADVLRHASWEDIRPHLIRGVVFLVSSIPLIDVGVALANDDKAKIATWIADNTIARPSPEVIAEWVDHKALFAALIVEPFVLVQLETTKKLEN